MVDFEEPQLGAVGVDAVTVNVGYRWELGWSAVVAWRYSGSEVWHRQGYAGRDAAELHALLSDHLANSLGLI